MATVPLFPLPMVAFPGETVSLHIFEPRYKEMIGLCLAEKRPFCIVSVDKGQISRVGTLIHIAEVTKTYDDGRRDLIGKGIDRVEILLVLSKQSYYEADIIPFDDISPAETPDPEIRKQVSEHYSVLMDMASKEAGHEAPPEPYDAFGYAQYVGFDLAKKQELLELRSEPLRLDMILNHLADVVPKIQAFENVKNRIIANGDFRQFPPLDLKI